MRRWHRTTIRRGKALSLSKLQTRLEDISRQLEPHFKPAFLQRATTVFQFRFDLGESFHLSVDGDAFQFLEGTTDTPTLTLYLDRHETCWQLLTGQLDGMDAFMAGKYRADGNIVLSQLLLYLFKSDDPIVVYQVQD